MNVLVDTSVWSLALRRNRPDTDVAKRLSRLISENRVTVIGPVRQEILSGLSSWTQFEKLQATLACFENEPVLDCDYIRAAEFNNLCRRNGIQGSHIDFLICACAYRLGTPVFTTDNDFGNYEKILPIFLFSE